VLEIARVAFAMWVVILFFIFWLSNIAAANAYALRAWPWVLPWLMLSALIAMHLALPASWLPMGWQVYPPKLHELLGDKLHLAPSAVAAISYWATFSTFWALAWMVSSLNRSGVRLLLWFIFIAALGQALTGLIMLVGRHDLNALLVFFGGAGSVWDYWGHADFKAHGRGTFYIYNNYAGYLGMAALLVLAGLLSDRGAGGLVRRVELRITLGVVFCLVVGMGLLASHSRLGVLASVVGFVVFGLLLLRRARGSESRWLSYGPWAALGVALIAGLWFGLDRLVERYFLLPDHTTRYEIWVALFDLPAGVWLVGPGASSFIDVYHLVRPSHLAEFFRAHNDWLQFVLEFGVIGTVLVLMAMVLWYRRNCRHSFSTLQLGALCALIAQGIHSLGDFDLQIPGAAIVFWVALGLVANPHIARRVLAPEHAR
jgi:hypothetical protein